MNNFEVFNQLRHIFQEPDNIPDVLLAKIAISQYPCSSKPNGWEVWVSTGKNNATSEFRNEPDLCRSDDEAFESLEDAKAYVEKVCREVLYRFLIWVEEGHKAYWWEKPQ